MTWLWLQGIIPEKSRASWWEWANSTQRSECELSAWSQATQSVVHPGYKGLLLECKSIHCFLNQESLSIKNVSWTAMWYSDLHSGTSTYSVMNLVWGHWQLVHESYLVYHWPRVGLLKLGAYRPFRSTSSNPFVVWLCVGCV